MKLKKYFFGLLKPAVLVLALLFLAGCEEKPSDVLWNEYEGIGNESLPVIESVTPADSAWATIDTIVITGKNFSTDTTAIKVWFNTTRVEIVEYGTNQLKIKSPDFVSDSVVIKVVTRLADKFAVHNYQLKEAIGAYFPFKKEDAPKAITFDKDGNLYVSLVINSVGAGIKKISPSNEISDFVPKGTETSWSALKVGGSTLYGAKGRAGVWKFEPGVVPPNAPWVIVDGNINDMDFDANGMMWAAGAHIYRIDPNLAASKKFPLPSGANIRSVRVFENYLYVGGTLSGKDGVWRYQILGPDDLGPQELFYDLSANYTGLVKAITFDITGRLYIGTSNVQNPILLVENGSGRFLYPGSLEGPADWFAWFDGPYMLYVKNVSAGESELIRVFTGSSTAPYYGLQL
jgi:hypothetical protein